jgi:hypothetical protein
VIEKSKCIRLKFEGGVIKFEDLQAFFYACLNLDPENSTEIHVITSIVDRALGSLSLSVEDE